MRVYNKQVVLTDFSGGVNGALSERLLPLKNARFSYNFEIIDGALTDGIGLELLAFENKKTLSVDKKVLALYYYKHYDVNIKDYRDFLMLYCEDKYVYSYDTLSGTLTKIEDFYLEAKPVGLTYNYSSEKDLFMFSTGDKGLYTFDGVKAEKHVKNIPSIVDMCLHNERLFVITQEEKTRLYFSDDFNPLNFSVSLTEGGYIDFCDERGGLNKIISAFGYLYIFRSYGISRLSSYYSQENFSVDHIFTSVGKIYSNSITLCDNGIMFLTSDGIYLFTSNSTKRVLKNLDGFFRGVDNSQSKGMFFGGKFYLKCKIKVDKQEDVLVVYDVNKNSGYLSKNLKVIDFCPIRGEGFALPAVVAGNGKEVFTFNQKASIKNVPITKVWETPFTDLGIEGKDKVLKKIELYTKNEVKVTVVSNNGTQSFLLKPRGDFASEKVNVRGREFKFIFSSMISGSEITKPSLYFAYV